MPTVDQHLRAVARSRPSTPFWMLEKDYALGYLLSGAYKTWGRVTNKDLGGFRKTIFRPKTAPNRRI